MTKELIMFRLEQIHHMVGEPTVENERDYEKFVINGVLPLLKKYDAKWLELEGEFAKGHSEQGVELAREIVKFLLKSEEGTEMYPSQVVEELAREYNVPLLDLVISDLRIGRE